jgi:hypothetical protein
MLIMLISSRSSMTIVQHKQIVQTTGLHAPKQRLLVLGIAVSVYFMIVVAGARM